MRTHAMVFDLDDTLIVDDAAIVQGLFATLAAIDSDRAAERLARVWSEAHRQWTVGPLDALGKKLGIAPIEALLTDFSDVHCVDAATATAVAGHQHAVWAAALEDANPDDVEMAVGRYKTEAGRRYTLRSGAIETLAYFRGRCRVVLLTNGPGDVQRGKLERLGLTDAFDEVLISGEVGIGKPESAFFELMLHRVGVSATQATMVGDHIDNDINAARRAGISAILFAPSEPERTAGDRCDRTEVVCRLTDLIGLLDA